MADNLLISDCY